MKATKWLIVIVILLCVSLYQYKYFVYDRDLTSRNNESLDLYKKSDGWYQVNTDPYFRLETYSDDEWDHVAFGTYPFIVSSLETNPINAEFARQYLQIPDNLLSSFTMFCDTPSNNSFEYYIKHYLIENHNREAGFYKHINLGSNLPDIVLGLYSSNEVPMESDELRYEIIGYAPLVFYVSESNEISELTTEQIVGIYSGEIENFEEIGGYKAKINPYQRSHLIYAQIMMQNIMGDTKMLTPKEIDSGGINPINPEPIEYKNSKGSIGYALGNAADKLYGSQIKLLSIDGVSPTDDNVRSGEYPYYAAVYAVTRNDGSDSVGNKFLDWILSDNGQKCIEFAGFVPVTDLAQ